MDLEANLPRDLADDLYGDARRVPHAFGSVGGICESEFDEGKAAA
jgi:hypothetical protein